MSFLIGLIDKYRFSNGERIKRVFEVGVLYGTTSLSLLKQGCKNDEFYLYGIDKGNADLFGEAVFNEASKEELEHYELHKGSTTADIENILKDKEKLDMIFIDAKHAHPYPLIDLIYLIPFLRKDALICMHDTGTIQPNYYGPSYVYLYWDGQKYRNYALDDKLEATNEQTMACIVANQGKERLCKNLLATAKIPFRATISSGDVSTSFGLTQNFIENLRSFMLKHYDESFVKEMSGILSNNDEEYKKVWPIYFYEAQFSLYMWHEIKKMDSLRSRLNKAEDLLKNFWSYQNEITKLWQEINRLKVANVLGNKIKYYRYVVASKITFGKTRQKYKAKRELLTAKLYS
ncbi:MAG: class I SAM-dependent methyltransferase [Elusimicrobiota bacterium]|jgi:predicted O-methyltransferase YrrM|nr:class I SAM-dependent methyltransferase [Elusimicrobiota bacterium]